MKVVIIGGGIAGVALGIFLHQQGTEFIIYERSLEIPLKGNAFLMHTDGLAILNELNRDGKAFLPGNELDFFSLKRPNGEEVKSTELETWKCMKRYDLLNFLVSLIPAGKRKEGKIFSHFLYEEEKIIAAVFHDGDVAYGDVFVGSDGGNSKVREKIFGKTAFSEVSVKEIVGISTNREVSAGYGSTFTKFQDAKRGLAFGFIPLSDTELVWFIQYDPRIKDLSVVSPGGLSTFCKELLSEFPPVVKELLESNDFENTYVWNTRDFDLLPSFHHHNVALIGDAAHLTLPFTSAGTTNAILDAKTLSACLLKPASLEIAFGNYYKIRANEVGKNILLGRNLKQAFLYPKQQKEQDIQVPLIIRKTKEQSAQRWKPVKILYFTEPVSSTCWVMQPYIRKLMLQYGKYIQFEYFMGGLLPSKLEYSKGKTSYLVDAANLWEDTHGNLNVSAEGDIWIENPLHSSYPASIAFKAAQLQDQYYALVFLRKIKEMVFLQKKSIDKEFIVEAAAESGLDSSRLLKDMEGRAKDLFFEDLAFAEHLGVKNFPTFVFSNQRGQRVSLTGYQSYEKLEKMMYSMIPDIEKIEFRADPESLFSTFNTMAEKEFAYLSNVPSDQALKTLDDLHKKGSLHRDQSKNGSVWKSNFKTKLN